MTEPVWAAPLSKEDLRRMKRRSFLLRARSLLLRVRSWGVSALFLWLLAVVVATGIVQVFAPAAPALTVSERLLLGLAIGTAGIVIVPLASALSSTGALPMSVAEATVELKRMHETKTVTKASVIAWYRFYEDRLPLKLFPESSPGDVERALSLWRELTTRGGKPEFPSQYRLQI